MHRKRKSDPQPEFEHEPLKQDEDRALVDRLRNLKWPEVPSEMRDRCWREFQQLIAARRRGTGHPEPGTGHPEPAERSPDERSPAE